MLCLRCIDTCHTPWRFPVRLAVPVCIFDNFVCVSHGISRTLATTKPLGASYNAFMGGIRDECRYALCC